MNLNSIEWAKAQHLLLQLIQGLSPLTSKKNGMGSFLNKRPFLPPSDGCEVLSVRHSVCVLKTTQEQVTKWIEQLPAHQGEPVSSGIGENKTSAVRGINPPLATQAQQLVNQVRDAIGTLCTSSNMIDPKAALLREALLRLKPLIDGMIKAVSHEGMHSADDESHTHSHIPNMHILRVPASENRIVLPGAPFNLETRPLSQLRKKKKRKGFWFRDHEEENASS